MAEIQSKILEDVRITLNSLDINGSSLVFQFPLWQELCHKELLVEGFCVVVGIPSREAAEIIGGLHSAGIKHVSFKPDSVEGMSASQWPIQTSPSSFNGLVAMRGTSLFT